jgi:hypothetical protein
MVILIIFLLLLNAISFFFFVIRSTFTVKRGEFARDAIGRYCDDLIRSGQYDVNVNYFEDMQISFTRYCFSFWLWDKYSRVKPEYKNILEPYFDR